MRKGRIKQLKQDLETQTSRMQFFHLDPKWEHYLEIINNKRLCNEQTHVINIWKLGCLATFGHYWSEYYTHQMLNEKSLEKSDIEFQKIEEKITKRAETKPTSTILDQLWYLYFATGEYDYLETAFSIAGNLQIKTQLREDALVMFEAIRDKYAEKITEALDHNENYFKDHPCPATRNAESNWDELDKVISGKKEELNDVDGNGLTDRELAELLAEPKYKFVSDKELREKMTPREREVHDGAKLFNKILARQNSERNEN